MAHQSAKRRCPGFVRPAVHVALSIHLNHLDAGDATIAAIDKEVDDNVEPFRVAIEMLTTIPGISSLAAEVMVSEIGIDMSRFKTEGHLISWAGLCPRNDESAGKRRSNRMKKGAPWLKTTLVQCAWAASRKKNSYLQAQYLRIRSRRGSKKAIGAVAASILTAAYHMLKDGTLYQDLGANHFDNRDKGKQALRLVNRLQSLGFTVQIKSMAA
jgi:transposase